MGGAGGERFKGRARRRRKRKSSAVPGEVGDGVRRGTAASETLPTADDWHPSKHLADGDVPLSRALDWALTKLALIRRPDVFDRRLGELESVLFPRLKSMLESKSDAKTVQAANVYCRLRAVHGQREVAAMEYAAECVRSLCTVELGRMQAAVAAESLGPAHGAQPADVLRELLPALAEEVWRRVQERRLPNPVERAPAS